MKLSAQIESLLFWKGEPLSFAELAKLLSNTEPAVKEAVAELEESLNNRGVKLVKNADKVMLVTAPATSELIERLTKEELAKDLGRAGLETISIILYAGPISRPEIDWIRGVNSSFILRHLLIRGLIERLPKPGDGRGYVYQPTFDLLNYLSVTKVEDLPDYESMRTAALAALKTNNEPA